MDERVKRRKLIQAEWIPCYYCGALEHQSRVFVRLVLYDDQVVRVCAECLAGRQNLQ